MNHLRLRPVFSRSCFTNSKKIQNLHGSVTSVRWNSSETGSKDTQPKKLGLFERFYGPKSNEASPTFKNRWLMAIPAFATHMCIGSPYAWSLMADTITREYGFVTSASEDWSMMEATLPLSIVFLLHGISGSVFGKWQLKVGTRLSIAAAGLAFGGGVMLGAAGITLHSLPLLYLGYGVMAGTGIGLGYTPPMQTLMQWFPDKKGVASGLTVAGFGSGALVFAPLVQSLMKKFAKLPEYVGSAKDVATSVVDGKLFATVNGSLVEVVNAGPAELAKLHYDLAEGLYVVGSGSSGAAAALGVVGAGYLAVSLTSSLLMKKPHASYVPPGMEAVNAAAATAGTNGKPVEKKELADITVDEAMKAPQFYLLGASFLCLASGGMGMFSVAKPMMSEVFSAALPQVVNSAFAAKFLLMLSAGSLAGRLGWATISDIIGRKKTFYIFGLASIPLYLSMPTIIDNVIETGSIAPLYVFIGSAVTTISIMGGTYSVLPAYEAELFGTSHVGPIHGRMLMFSSTAAIVGPYVLLKLRSISEKNAIMDLITKVTPEKFQLTFGAPIEKAADMIEAKTLTIAKLMNIVPPGTADPSPFLYNTTMYTMTGLMAASVLLNAMVKPTNRKLVSNEKIIDMPETASKIVMESSSDAAGDRLINK